MKKKDFEYKVKKFVPKRPIKPVGFLLDVFCLSSANKVIKTKKIFNLVIC